MKMKCVGIGKTVGEYGLEQVQTYVKRIQRFMPFEWIELKEVKHHMETIMAMFHLKMLILEKLASYIEKGTIQIAPMAFMRGRTLDDAFVILDEAQNTTHNQMKMFLTRMGKNTKFVITGDPGQIDLPRRVISGLKEALLILSDVNGIDVIQLDGRDVIRHQLVKKVIDAYKKTEHHN